MISVFISDVTLTKYYPYTDDLQKILNRKKTIILLVKIKKKVNISKMVRKKKMASVSKYPRTKCHSLNPYRAAFEG